MTKYSGPCEWCGEHVEREIRPGRRKYHLECGIAAISHHNRTMADGTNPGLEASRQAGAATAESIKKRQGKAYARWVGGMARHLDELNTTE